MSLKKSTEMLNVELWLGDNDESSQTQMRPLSSTHLTLTSPPAGDITVPMTSTTPGPMHHCVSIVHTVPLDPLKKKINRRGKHLPLTSYSNQEQIWRTTGHKRKRNTSGTHLSLPVCWEKVSQWVSRRELTRNLLKCKHENTFKLNKKPN